MNPITLQFQDQKIARLYDQQEQYNLLQFKVYLIISGLTLLFGSVYVLTNIDSIQTVSTLITLGITVYSFLPTIFVLKFRQQTNLALFFFNLLFSFNLFELPPTYDPYIGVIMGISQMTIHTSLLYIMKFRWSIVSTILIFLNFLINTTYRSEMKYFQYIFVTIISVTFMMCLYVFERTKRERFVLNQKDNTIEKIFPQFIKKPFYIFKYDDKKCCLDLLIQRCLVKENIQYNLEYILENTFYKKQILKKYIYQQISMIEKTQLIKKKHYLDVIFNDQKHIVKFEYFQQYYMLSIDTMQELIIKLRQRHAIGINRMQNYIIRVLYTLSKLNNFDQDAMIRLQLTIHQLINYIKMINTKKQIKFFEKSTVIEASEINIFTEFSNIISYLRYKAKRKVTLDGQCEILVEYPQKLFQIFLFELFKLIKFKKSLHVEIQQYEQIRITMNGVTNFFKESKIFKDLSQLFVDTITYEHNKLQLLLKYEVDLPFQYIGVIDDSLPISIK